MRIIDGDKLMETIRNNDYPLKSHFNRTDNGMFTIGIQLAVDIQPTVDAAPVKHGKWNHIGTLKLYVGMSVETCSEFRCSVCDSPQTFFVPIAHYHYCPQCGAKMDLEETT